MLSRRARYIGLMTVLSGFLVGGIVGGRQLEANMVKAEAPEMINNELAQSKAEMETQRSPVYNPKFDEANMKYEGELRTLEAAGVDVENNQVAPDAAEVIQTTERALINQGKKGATEDIRESAEQQRDEIEDVLNRCGLVTDKYGRLHKMK